jgi:protein gp37
MGQAHRFSGPGKPYEGLTTIRRGKVDWVGKARLVPEMLTQPLKWKKALRIFVNSMSDLFHESLSFEEIAAVFGVMASCPQHTFQVLTKRPKRALEFFAWTVDDGDKFDLCRFGPSSLLTCAWAFCESSDEEPLPNKDRFGEKWPLPNVHLGVSVENQATADDRIPLLLQCPAAVRFVSAEPLLGAVNICQVQDGKTRPAGFSARYTILADLDWIIVGGESGHGARPCNVEWIRSIVGQCKEANVPVFVKQVGAAAYDPREQARTESFHGMNARFGGDVHHKKGADPSEWPADLRVRQFPEVSPEWEKFREAY